MEDQSLGISRLAGAALPALGLWPLAVAMMRSGVWPRSTQLTNGVRASNWSVAGPALQWFMPGMGK